MILNIAMLAERAEEATVPSCSGEAVNRGVNVLRRRIMATSTPGRVAWRQSNANQLNVTQLEAPLDLTFRDRSVEASRKSSSSNEPINFA